MPETVALKAEVRNEVGTKYAARLRRAGKLPAIVYGHGAEPVAVSLDLHNFAELLRRGHRLFDVKTGKTSETLLVKDLQYDHLGKDIIHVDMVRVDLTETVRVTVPIELKGTAKGAHEGGIVDEHLDHLEIECKAGEIPEVIPVSIKELGVGDAIHARDIELPEGMKLATSPETLVLTCHLVAAAKSTEELEEGMPSAPEVITEKVDQEGEDASE
jgi:large subunit ribosomal protein L25